jgi:hypothetical protein
MLDILVTDIGMYVNHRLPCLAKYKDSINVIKLEVATNDIDSDVKVVDVSAEKEDMDTTKTGYDSWQYQCITGHAKEIVDLFKVGTGRNTLHHSVLILGDINMEILYALYVLQNSEYKADIHLILPIPFEKTVRGTIQHEILSNLNKVRTLAIYDPYKIAKDKYGSTETEIIERVINEQTEYLLDRFENLIHKMPYQEYNTKYFFDFEKDSYIDTESLYVLDDHEITHTLGLFHDPYFIYENQEENKYLIECLQKPTPRPDGKLICEQLRSIRKEFARLNGIDYKFKECTYNAPCGGTCKACDNEARELGKLAEKIGNVKYPEVKLEES